MRGVVWVWVAWAACECGSPVVTPGDSGGGTDGSQNNHDGAAGSDAATQGDTIAHPTDAVASGCPATMPTQGQTCAPSNEMCEYGTDPRVDCRAEATCSAGSWQLAVMACDPPNQGCPGSAPASMVSCMTMDQFCAYPDGTRCDCAPCPPGGALCAPGPLSWYCLAVPGNGCPIQPPMSAPCARRAA